MVGIMFVMIAVIIAMDIVYYIKTSEGIADRITRLTQAGGSPAQIAESIAKFKSEYSYCYTSQRVIIAQIVLLVVAALLVAFLPLYRPLLKKINTSIEVEGNDDMETIELEADEA